MRLNCEVEVVYSLALAASASASTCKSSRSRASLCLGKKPAPVRGVGSSKEDSTGSQRSRDELYLMVSTAKKVQGYNYKVSDHDTGTESTHPLILEPDLLNYWRSERSG